MGSLEVREAVSAEDHAFPKGTLDEARKLGQMMPGPEANFDRLSRRFISYGYRRVGLLRCDGYGLLD